MASRVADGVGVSRLLLLSLLAVAVFAACGHSSSETLVLDRSIGPVHLEELRVQIEHRIGKGRVVSSRLDHSASPEPVREEQVAYDRRHLVVWYVSDKHHAPFAEILETTSSRYRTISGIGVGASYAQLRKLGVDCYGSDCQHFHGHNKPGTLFRMTTPHGEVAQILVIAATD
jgi:hypothetical protein